jgi:hypothetical protein
MQLRNYLLHLKEKALVITPGDRDIIWVHCKLMNLQIILRFQA